VVDFSLLASLGPCIKFSAGQNIPVGGALPERQLYILLTGMVDVYKESVAGGKQNIGSLLPGDVFAGREFFTDFDECSYQAGIDSVVYVITRASFSDLSWSHPEILFEVFAAAYRPLRKMSASQKIATAKASEIVAPADSTRQNKKPKEPNTAVQEIARTNAGDGKTAEQQKTKAAIGLSLPDSAGIFPQGHKSYPNITRHEYTRLVFPKEYVCPSCKTSFTDYRVFRSKLYEAAPMRYDLRRYYTDFQVQWYDVIACHRCYFSAFHNYFTEPKPIQKVKFENELISVRQHIQIDFEQERDIDFVFTLHYLALICSHGYLSAGRQIRAKLWGNLSWLYEDVGDKEMEKFAANKAAEAYEECFAQNQLTPIGEQVTCLSVAGMQYRAGVDRDLKRFLFTAKTVKLGDKTYAKLAEDFMYELRSKDAQ